MPFLLGHRVRLFQLMLWVRSVCCQLTAARVMYGRDGQAGPLRSEPHETLLVMMLVIRGNGADARPASLLFIVRRLHAGLTAYTAQSGSPHCDAVPFGAPGASVPVVASRTACLAGADSNVCDARPLRSRR